VWTHVRTVLLGFIPVALGLLAVVLYLRFAKILPTYTSTPGPLMVGAGTKKTEKVERVAVPGPPRIIYLEKASLSARLKLPELNLLPDNVLGVVSVSPHSGPTTAIATLTPEGEGRILLRQEPTPFFSLKRDFRLQGRYLFVGSTVAELDLVANPLRVGPVELVAGVGVGMDREDSTLQGRAFVGAEIRF
jgi:hypothetical protein